MIDCGVFVIDTPVLGSISFFNKGDALMVNVRIIEIPILIIRIDSLASASGPRLIRDSGAAVRIITARPDIVFCGGVLIHYIAAPGIVIGIGSLPGDGTAVSHSFVISLRSFIRLRESF